MSDHSFPSRQARTGFTVLETLTALGFLVMGMVVVAQVGIWSLHDRTRGITEQETLEAAANVLESARATPFDALDAKWAEAQRLPEGVARRLPGARLAVKVEPDPSHKLLKRVTVEILPDKKDRSPGRPIKLVGVFGPRSAQVKGAKS